jgi:hypothetical protein
MTTSKTCKCGCGETVRGKRVFVNKEHQLAWMHAGGARELNAMMPDEARALGGQTAGKQAAESGRLQEAAKLGGQRAREIAEAFRKSQDG